MTRYVWDRCAMRFVDPKTGEPMETSGDGVCRPMILSDIPAYMSPLGTGLIDGRTARREDLKRSGCREVDPQEWRPSDKYLEKRDSFGKSRA